MLFDSHLIATVAVLVAKADKALLLVASTRVLQVITIIVPQEAETCHLAAEVQTQTALAEVYLLPAAEPAIL